MPKILIGGNSSTIKNHVISEIQKAGWDICYAENHDEVKTALKHQNQILAIIIDNDLPVFSFANQKFEHCELPSPKPLWILTAQSDHFFALAYAFQAGFDEFLAKPLGEDLITLLKYKTAISNNTKK